MAKAIKIKKSYKCPLCKCCFGDNSMFFYTKILNKPVCHACSIEIDAYICDDRADDLVIKKLIKASKLPFNKIKRIHYLENIENFKEKLKPSNVEKETKIQMKITKETQDDVINGWKKLIKYYKSKLSKL